MKLKEAQKQDTKKTAGAVFTATGSESTEREQTPYSTQSLFLQMIISFHQPGTGR